MSRRFGLCLPFVAVALSTFNSGCKREYATTEQMQEQHRKEVAPILEKHRAAATAKIDAIKAVAADATAVPPVTKRETTGGKVIAPDVVQDPMPLGLLIANMEWAANLKSNHEVLVNYKVELPMSILLQVLDKGEAYDRGYTALGIDEKFVVLEGLKQIALIRVRKYDPPKMVSVGAVRRFEAGKSSGDVLIYDLENRQRIGAFPIEVGQSDKATIYEKDEAAIQRELEQSYASGFAYEVRKELAAYAEGKAGPAAPGVAAVTSLSRFGEKIRSEIMTEYFWAGPKSVTIEPGDDGIPLVTIYAETPRQLASKTGVVSPKVIAIVEKVLGRKAVVKVLPAETPASGPTSAPTPPAAKPPAE